MIKSMTGFGSSQKNIPPFGKLAVELRSANHKFLETVVHLPAGLLSLEGKIKKVIESKVKRGRVTCVINLLGPATSQVYINQELVQGYLAAVKKLSQRFSLSEGVDINTLLHLPGVVSLTENRITAGSFWRYLNALLLQVLEDLLRARQKEGYAIEVYLKIRLRKLKSDLQAIEVRFKKVVKERLAAVKTAEEQAAFLKESDISEENERLAFHLHNFINRLSRKGPLGKELDFIAQEMQREANTMGAKSCDTLISGKVVEIKSQIEKLREQLQNIE